MEVIQRYKPLIDNFKKFKNKCKTSLPRVVRVNEIKSTINKTKNLLQKQGIKWEEIDWNPNLLKINTEKPGNTWAHFHGFIHAQEEVSTIPPIILDPRKDEYIWDSCAAPGSKTCQMADLMGDRGVLIANDSNTGRISALRNNTERLGVTNVLVTNQDGRNFSTSSRFSSSKYEKFDKSLVDVPCSCEGTLRKNPNVLKDWSIKKINNLSKIQHEILKRAIDITKKNGTIVYSTCTFAPEENEEVLNRIIRKRQNCKLIDFDIPLDFSPGITEWNGKKYKDSLKKAKRIYPHQNDTGGFFCAKLKKK